MAGKRINIYVKSDFEKEAVKEFIKRYREDIAAYKEVKLSPAQEEMLSTILKEFAEIKKLLPQQQENNTMPVDSPEDLRKRDEDYMRKMGLID